MKTKTSRPTENGASTTENGTVPPKRLPYSELRTREHLTPAEVELVIKTARQRPGRHGHRDGTMILLCYRHVLRVSELASLRWDQFDFEQGVVHVRRIKNGRIRVRRRSATVSSPAAMGRV